MRQMLKFCINLMIYVRVFYLFHTHIILLICNNKKTFSIVFFITIKINFFEITKILK